MSAVRKGVCVAASKLSSFLTSIRSFANLSASLAITTINQNNQNEEEEGGRRNKGERYVDISIGIDLDVQICTGEESKKHPTALASIFISFYLFLSFRESYF